VDYASSLAHKALAGAAGKGGRMLPEDLLFLLRKVHWPLPFPTRFFFHLLTLSRLDGSV